MILNVMSDRCNFSPSGYQYLPEDSAVPHPTPEDQSSSRGRLQAEISEPVVIESEVHFLYDLEANSIHCDGAKILSMHCVKIER